MARSRWSPVRLLPVIPLLALAAGCTSASGGVRTGVDRSADKQAEQIGRWLDERPWAVHKSLDLARALLGEPTWRTTEVLSATGERRDGSAELLVRITVLDQPSGSGSGADLRPRCRLLAQTGPDNGFEPQRQDCPAEAVALSPTPEGPPPTVPPGYDERLAAALRALPAADRAVPARVEAVARRLLGRSPAAVRTATAASGTVGLAVSANRYDCVLAAVDGSVSVWRPPPVYLEPGEGGCSADAAANRQLQRDPH